MTNQNTSTTVQNVPVKKTNKRKRVNNKNKVVTVENKPVEVKNEPQEVIYTKEEQELIDRLDEIVNETIAILADEKNKRVVTVKKQTLWQRIKSWFKRK